MSSSIGPTSHGLWRDTASSPPATQPLVSNSQVDIAIIGAGYTGLSTALHLVKNAGISVAVLEAQEIGFGASGRNAGMVNAGAWIEPNELPKRLGQDYGTRLLQLLGAGPAIVYELIAQHGIHCDAYQNGNLHCAIGQHGLTTIRKRAQQWREHGVQVQLLDAAATAQLVGTSAYSGALLDPRTGTIQPLSYARGLARAAIELGAQIYTQSVVTQASNVKGQWRLVTASGATLQARQVVVASNTRQSNISDAWPQLQQELLRMPYFNIATAPLSKSLQQRILPAGRGAWDTAAILSSYRVDPSGRLVYGSVGAIGKNGIRGGDAHVKWTQRAIAKLFPELRGIEIDYAWHGWVDATANQLPRIHQLAPNAWSISGYNGRGIAAGTILGRELARMLLGQIAVQDLPIPVSHNIKPIRFKSAWERLYLDAAMLAHAVDKRI